MKTPTPLTSMKNPATPLTFDLVARQSFSRANRWHEKTGGLQSWSASDWACAMAGEMGEACNAVKKLRRLEDQIPNINTFDRRLTERLQACHAIGDELADTILYAFCLAAKLNLNLENHVRKVFNAKSDEYGFPEQI